MTPFLNELRKSVSIADIVGEYVKLRKQGSNLSGLCPFHAERSPSFSVSENKGVFYCFGCQKGGDVITFIQEVQGMGFPDAVRYLASKAGLKVPAQLQGGGKSSPLDSSLNNAAQSNSAQDEVSYKLNRFVAQFYHEMLLSDRGQAAREYLKTRGIDDEIIKTAYLGFAPDDWSALHDFLVSKKAPLEAAEKLGLIRKKTADAGGREYYDLFRDRVMFPVTDRKGRVVAFGGRTLKTGEGEGPKYLNSSDSPIFTKGQHLYGIFQAQKHIRAEDLCVIVEGYMDALALQQAGIGCVVATLGTALTENHVGAIKRLTQNIVALFDGDTAGRAAQTRAMEIFLKDGIVVKGIALPDGVDPDDYIRTAGAEALRQQLNKAPYLLDEHILDLKSQAGGRPEDRTRALEQILPWIARLRSDTGILLRLQDLSEHFAVPLSLLERRIAELRQPMRKENRPQVGPSRPTANRRSVLRFDKVDVLFLEYAVRFPLQLLQVKDFDTVLKAILSPEIRSVIETALTAAQEGRLLDVALTDTIEAPDLKVIMSRVLTAGGDNLVPETMKEQELMEWEDLVRHLKRRGLESSRDSLRESIKKADALGQQDELRRLMSEFNELQKFLDHEIKGGQISL